MDLDLLLYANGDKSITQEDRERLIQTYHSKLTEMLVRLKYPKKIPSLIDIQVVAYRMDLYTSLVILLCTGLRYMNASFDGGSIEMSKSIGEKTGGMYSHPDCQAQLKYLLNMFDRRGYFDFDA